MPAPQAHYNGTWQPPALLVCSDLPYATKTRTIGPAGGRIRVGPHVLRIPRGALDTATQITMTMPRGRGVNAVHFEPEGLRFNESAALTMSYANCSLRGRRQPKRIAYVDESLNILYYLLSRDNIHSGRVTGKVDHFSDYVIAW